MFHGFIFPAIFLAWIFGHGIGSIFTVLILLWAFGWIFHPWRRWGYHPYYYSRRWGGPPPASSALDILEERYAKGDVTREEYLQKKQDLQNRGL